ncbi:MAG: hypothetical protein H6Q72_1073 [Firmicutes bacterium]|nr:hypothetical protein [Bacillota bacterium]
MKKPLFMFLIMAMVVSVSSGICFAGAGDGLQNYVEEQAAKPVVLDQEYPQWGFRVHSWLTGTGSETLAHTQVIEMSTGMVIKEFNRKCNYTDPVYDYNSN